MTWAAREEWCVQTAGIDQEPLMCSMPTRDHFFHDFAARRLQWPHAAAGQEPHPFILVAAINNIHAVAGDRVLECRAGFLGNESEESFSAWIICQTEHLSPKLL